MTTSYYVKDNHKIFKFSCWTDLENYTGKDRSLYKNFPLSKGIRQTFNNCRIIGRWAAFFEGWIDENDNPQNGYTKGNASWT